MIAGTFNIAADLKMHLFGASKTTINNYASNRHLPLVPLFSFRNTDQLHNLTIIIALDFVACCEKYRLRVSIPSVNYDLAR